MSDNDVDLLSALHPLPPKLIRLKRAFVSFLYVFAVVAFGWSLLFEAPAALSLFGIAALLVAMHFELSSRIDVLNHVCASLHEQVQAIGAAQSSMMDNCVEDANSVLETARTVLRAVETNNALHETNKRV